MSYRLENVAYRQLFDACAPYNGKMLHIGNFGMTVAIASPGPIGHCLGVYGITQ